MSGFSNPADERNASVCGPDVAGNDGRARERNPRASRGEYT
jgi:hypothetical protein